LSALSTARRNAIILAALLFLQLVLMAGSARKVGGASLLESWFLRLSSPVVGAARIVGGGFDTIGSGIGNLFHAHSRNAALQAEVVRLREELQASREAALETERLRRLLGMREPLAGGSVAASVVTAALTQQTQMIVVDRGTDDGVVVDAPVVAWGGAVGRVLTASAGHAKVQLLTDPNSGVAGVVQRSRVQGMVFGRGEHPLELLYVARFSDVLQGDRLVTSGLDGIFPRGFGVGIVEQANVVPSGDQTFQLHRELDYAALEEVLILPRPVDEDLAAQVGEEER
jgi:rod shape-determining protein MreC